MATKLPLSGIRIKTKLILLNLIIIAAFLVLISVILISCDMIGSKVTDMTNREINRAAAISRLTRNVTKVMAGVDILHHTVPVKHDRMALEGDKLSHGMELISESIADPALKQPVHALNEKIRLFLDQCLTVNTLFHRRWEIRNQLREQLANLEKRVARISGTMAPAGPGTNRPGKLLSLVAACRERLLEIDKLASEFGGGNAAMSIESVLSPVIAEISDLVLRFEDTARTIPGLSPPGDTLHTRITGYKEATLAFLAGLETLSACAAQVKTANASLMSTIKGIETEIAGTTRKLAENIQKAMGSASLFLVAVSIAIILILGLFTAYLFKSTIYTPMQKILKDIARLDAGRLDVRVRLNRGDEWTLIEQGLNDMTAKLSDSYSALAQSREKLKASETFLNTIVENIPIMVIVKDAATLRFVRINKATEDLIGYSREEMLGKTLYDLFPERESDFFAAIDRDILKHQKEIEIPEARFRTRHRGERILYSKKLPLFNRNKDLRYILEICQDITERRLLDNRMHQIEKAESLSRMASAVAHNFNNMLAAVIGNIELAIEDIPADHDAAGYLKGADEAARKASDMSRLMLTYLGHQQMESEPMDLSKACRDCIKQLSVEFGRQLHFETNLPAPGPVIEANFPQICQLLSSLATNAQEALPDSSGPVFVKTGTASAWEIADEFRFPTQWEAVTDTYAWLAVSDPGHGMDPETVGRIFDPFYTSKFTGRGLGLAVALGIVKAHHGCITVESAPGRGSTFRIFFPVSAKAIRAPETASEEKAPDTAAPMAGRILLVEDQDIVRKTAQAILSHLGFDPFLASNGAEAVRIFVENADDICLVISDLSMPGMDGWETLAALRSVRSDIPVILASGYNEEQVMAGDHAEQPQAFLNKPYQIKILKSTIEKVLGDPGT